ncbi:MAG: hypothetical protein HRU19_07050 [Pseudobacteriovorax sp.]|nr:hypothetical protein [Pseudobacteriovorax sp.]
MKTLLTIVLSMTLNWWSPGQAKAEPAPVSLSQFEPGNFWVWRYEDAKGNLNSYERYRVLETSGSQITFLMETKFPGERSFKSHHRLSVDLRACLQAHIDPSRAARWSLTEFSYWYNDSWVSTGNGRNVQAFEEKFSCQQTLDRKKIQYIYEELQIDGEFGESSWVFRNQTRFPKAGQFDSWYIKDHDTLNGVAAFKVFNPDRPKQLYRFYLDSWGNLKRGF